jgi:hypothetical protein
MSSSKRQKVTAEEVEREASRYIVYELGDRLWAGEPVYDERSELWTVPIHSLSLPADVALEHLTLDAHGVLVHTPSRRALQRAIQQHQSTAQEPLALPELPDDPQTMARPKQ